MTKQEIIDKAQSIPGTQVSPYDCDLLYDLCQQYIRPNGYALEVGTWKGSSGYVIGSVCKEKNAILYTVDTFRGVEDPNSRKNQEGNLGGYYEAIISTNFIQHAIENLKGLPVKIIQGDSNKILPTLPDRMFDFAFIDGNHEPPTVDNDIRTSIQKMRLGGMLCGHDHGNPDGDVHGAVKRVLNDEFVLHKRPVGVDYQYLLTIWCHEIKEGDYAKV